MCLSTMALRIKDRTLPCLVELCGLRDIYTMFMTITNLAIEDSSTAFTKMKTILLSWILYPGPERESLAFQKSNGNP